MKFHFMNSKGVINLEEVWKYIKGYEGLYQVSSWGRVKRVNTGRILKTIIGKDGYIQINLCKHGIQTRYKVHRLVAQAFIPNPQNKPQVNHIDEDKENNHVENLEWVTNQENMLHNDLYKRCVKHAKKPVICLETNEKFESITQLSKYLKLGISTVSEKIKYNKPINGLHYMKEE